METQKPTNVMVFNGTKLRFFFTKQKIEDIPAAFCIVCSVQIISWMD